jgi:hypothetical protein
MITLRPTKLLAISLLFITFVAACATATPQIPTSTPTLRPTTTKTAVLLSATPSLTSMRTPRPSRTPRSTNTDGPSPTAGPTSTPWPTTALSVTQTYVQLSIKNMLQKCQEAYNGFDRSESPDGIWTAYECPSLAEFRFMNKDASIRWTLPYVRFSRHGGRPDTLSIYRWSDDSQYVYFSPFVLALNANQGGVLEELVR